MNNQQLAKLPDGKFLSQLNETVSSVIGTENIQGFERAFRIASATQFLKQALTKEYMAPIMELQGNKLGFKADKIYDESVVKNCLIEAVLTGVQPFGNQFNIIAGNCYITKEGFGYLLSKVPGLTYEIVPQLPRINAQSAAIVMKIEWSLNGQKSSREIDFAIKVNQYMGADAVIGKATRKARAWLYNTITGQEVGDGDVTDVPANVVESKVNSGAQLPSVEELQTLLDTVEGAINKQEYEEAKQIIATNDTTRFAKLHKFLTSKLQPNGNQ